MSRFFSLSILIFQTFYILSTNYYINEVEGSDANSGLDPGLAWKSLVNVNGKQFLPGDTIFLARGCCWYEFLEPGGSGSENAPIVITAYGEGTPPLLIGTGEEGKGVVSLFNQSYWEISSLEIVNNSEMYGDRRGVEVLACNAGVVRHIYLRDLHIHHIAGLPGNSMSAKKTAGIYFGANDDDSIFTRFDDVLIEGCIIHDVVNQGIALAHEKFQGSMYPGEGTWEKRKFTRFAIRDNVIYNISKNAMIVRMTEGGVVERNLCFNTALNGTGNTIFSRNVLNTLFQHNEGFLNRSHDHDGSLYDPDLNSPETIWRYSYSHRNAHGLLWLCTTENDSEISVYRNISENDKGVLNYFNYPYNSVDVYENIYISGKRSQSYLIRENPSNYHHSTHFRDNVIVNRSKKMQFEYQPQKVSPASKMRRTIRGNLYFGIPLQGEYNSDKQRVFHSKYIHRGFHHTPDEVDKLFEQTPLNLNVSESVIDDEVLCTINGVAIYNKEFEKKLRELKVESFSLNRRKPDLDSLRRTTMDELLLEKLSVSWMVQKGLKVADVLLNLDSFLLAENSFRKNNILMNDSLFFGPQSFKRDSYNAYIFAFGTEELKEKMLGDELKATEEELKEFFLVGDLERFDPKWESRGYDYSLPAVKRLLRDKKFENLLLQEFNKRNVD